MTTQDSWIDPDELDELVGVFSNKKKKKAKKKSKSASVARKGESDERPPRAKRKKSAGKVKSVKADKAGKLSPVSVKGSSETVAISSIDDLDSYLEEDSPPPLVFGEEGDSSLEEVEPEANKVPEAESLVESPAEVAGAVEEVVEDAESESEEELIVPEGGSVVFVSNEGDGEEEKHHPTAFDIDSDADEKVGTESVEPDYVLDESSFEDTAEAEPGEELAADEEPREIPLYDGGMQDQITVDSEEAEDEYGSTNPSLLSNEDEAEIEEDTTREDAEKAVKALAEARAEAESAELIRLRKWASIEEEPEISSSDEEEETEDEPEEIDLLDGGMEESGADLITVHEVDENSGDGKVEAAEEELEPLPEFRTLPSATMVERVAGYADFLRRGIQAKSIVIRDDRGFLIYDDGQAERKLTAASFDTLRALRNLNGTGGGLFSQIKLTDSEWFCVISSRGAEGDLFTQLVIGEPVRPSRLMELANTLSDAIAPPKAA